MKREKQINLNTNPQFEKDLKILMLNFGIKTKTEAIRVVVHEAAKRSMQKKTETSFRAWIGAGLKAPLNAHPKFKSEDDLW